MITGLINEYIQSTIQSAIDGGYATIHDTDYVTNANTRRVTISIGKIRVYAYNGTKCTLDIGCQQREDGPCAYIKAWKNDVGGLFIKDVKSDRKELYKEIVVGDVTKCLVREMTKEDVADAIQDNKPYAIVVFDKDTDPKYYCIIKVIDCKKSYSDEGKEWYSDIYNPEEDEELRKRLEKEDKIEESKEELNDDSDLHFADLGIFNYNGSAEYDE